MSLWVLRRLHLVLVVNRLHVDIPFGCHVGPGLRLPHPMNIVVNSRARIGSSVTLYHGVTLAESSRTGAREAPTLEDRVVIGTNAVVIGGVLVGADVSVGANAVVSKNVPENCTVVGINDIR